MNRKSLFGRLSASTIVSRPAERQSYFRLQLEPLEDRKLLTVATTYVNDNWYDTSTTDGIVRPGDGMINLNDTINPGAIFGTYGTSAFGLATKWNGGSISSNPTNYSTTAYQTIHAAIQGTNLLNGSVDILEGTYKESDIVIDRPLAFTGAGKTGATRTLIIPEDTATSALDDSQDFPAGIREGIIIYSPDVTVSNIALDGNGNATTTANAGHTLNYHQGITTLYDPSIGTYSSLRDGNLIPKRLGNPVDSVATRTRANIAVQDVAVSNVYFHGITLSALAGEQWGTNNGAGQNVDRAIVTNVGDVDGLHTQNEKHVGILIQNVDNGPFGAPADGNIRYSTVTNAGTGIKTGVFGTASYNSQAAARIRAGMIQNTVIDAVKRGYEMDFMDGSEGLRGNVATFNNLSNNAEGVYLNHSRALLTGFVINGAKVGIHVQNTPLTGSEVVILGIGGNIFTGPGTGVAGSVGLLIDNSASESDSSRVMLGSGTTISGYQTGVRAEQVVPDTVATDGSGHTASRIELDMANPSFGVNGTGIVLGNGATMFGNYSGTSSLTTTGSAIVSPGYPNWANYAYLVPGNTGKDQNPSTENSPAFLAPPTSDVINTGSVALNSATTFTPLLTNQAGTTPLFNFNAALNFPFALVPDAPNEALVPSPNGVLFNWYGNLTQDGSGTIVLGGTATNGKGLDYAFAGNNSGPIPNTTPTLYQLQGTDISNRTTLNIVAKKLATNQAETIGIGLFDVRGNANLWTFKMADLSSTAYTTLKVNLLAPSIDLTGPDSHIDLTKIAGWVFGGDQGAVNGNQNVPLGFIVDDMYADSIGSSQLNVTGSVNLGLSTLNLSASPTFVPSAGQQFVIVNNDGADAVTSSFAGFAQGSTTVIGGHTFSISYTGGTGNDVVLTEESPILDLNGASAGTGFTNDWSKILAAPVDITASSAATVNDGGGTLVSLSAQITNWHTGDILLATPPGGSGITASWNAGTNTLQLTGSSSAANYQTALRSIKYNNSAGGAGVSPVNITVTASDGTYTSAPVLATITDPAPQLDLNGATGGTGGQAAWTVGAGAVNITEVDATVTDADDTTLASMTATITVGVNINNSLTFDTTGTSITGTYNAGTSVLSLTGTDTIDHYQQVLRTIKYNNSGDPGVNEIRVSFVASDGVVTGPAQLSIITVNLPLVVDLAGTAGLDNTTSWVNNGPINIADISSAIVTDTVDGSPDNIVITITNPHAGDILTATDSGGVTSSWDATSNTMTLTGNVAAANYQTVLRTVKYNNTFGGPGVSVNVGTVNINVVGHSGAVTSRTAVSHIVVPPVIDLNGTTGVQSAGNGFNATWSNSGSISITDTDATVISPGRPNLIYMTVKITQNGTNGITEFHTGDVLTASTAGLPITQTYSNGVLTLTGEATPAQYQQVLRTIKYNNTNGGPGAGAQIFVEFLTDDDDHKSTVSTSTITISVPLSVDLNGPSGGTGFINNVSPWTTSGSPQAPLSATTARVTDTGGTDYTTATGRNLTSMTATIGTDLAKSGGVHQGDILTATSLVGGITQSYNALTGVLTLTGNSSSANYQTVLRSIRYDNSSAFGGPGADFVYIWFVGVDTLNIHSNAALGQLDINSKENIDLNGPAVGSDYATTWTNSGPVNLTTNDATVKDGDRAYLTSMTVNIGNPHAGDGLSAIVTGTNIDVQGIGSTQLVFNAKPPLNTDELVNWQTVLRSVQYFNTLGGPGVGQVFIDFDYTDSFAAVGTTRTTTVNINVVSNQPPALDLNGGVAGTGFGSTWTNTGAVNITDAAVAAVTDSDSANLASITATITGGANANNVLSATTTGTSISASYNAGSGVLTLSGSDTLAHYQQVLRTVKYNNTAGGPGAGPVTVSFVANDGALNSTPVVATISTRTASVAKQLLFYNQSGTSTRYDHNDLAINSFDDLAIATDKTAYTWENPGAATFANVSSYTKGINGIMVDIAGPHGTITAADFIFRVGNNNSPGLWTTANAPTSISVRAGAGVSGSDRVEIIWNTGAPFKQWLEVITLATDNTGLPQKAGYPAGQADAFFFGNAPGNTGTGDTGSNSLVNSLDEAAIRANNALVNANIPITNVYDVGRNASVNVVDESAARLNGTNPSTTLKYLNLTTAPAAPEADGGDVSPLVAGDSASGDSGVASALTASAPTAAPAGLPRWILNRLDSVDLNSGTPAKLFQHLHDVNMPATRALLQKFDAAADALGLDDELLDSLLADLGLE